MTRDRLTPDRLATPKANAMSLVLGLLILAALVVGAYRIDQQARRINGVVDAQSVLVFIFEVQNPPPGAPTLVDVTCTRHIDKPVYSCSTVRR